ncbi:MAG TPA: hypothetical protein DCX03_01860, partial [Bacteroidales bacterium]|nr:hypothetical protein [Bacteroidales bacterium]
MFPVVEVNKMVTPGHVQLICRVFTQRLLKGYFRHYKKKSCQWTLEIKIIGLIRRTKMNLSLRPNQHKRISAVRLYLTGWLLFSFILLTTLAFAYPGPLPPEENITAPEAFFGFKLGTDRKIARWDKIVEYFELLQKESPRLKVINMGPTTMGHPFLLIIISSPENLANLEKFKEINQKI